MSSNKTLSAIVANKIENQIICGNWQVGSQIPPEQELMQTFDVSRITIREAIKTLVSRDVLEIRRGCGTFVSAVPGLSDDPLGLRFIASDDLNTYLFEARQILEPSVCRLAAQRGDALGCLDGDRANEVYRLTRLQMERAGMHGDRGLYEAIMRLEQRCRVVLLSNSYEETVREFLRQLGFAGAFREICSSANKPYGMIASLQALDPALLARPEALISIGDHAFNDLMPISAIGGQTLWIDPYPGIHEPEYTRCVHTLAELAAFLDTIS